MCQGEKIQEEEYSTLSQADMLDHLFMMRFTKIAVENAP
jgi:hypothetical protein